MKVKLSDLRRFTPPGSISAGTQTQDSCLQQQCFLCFYMLSLQHVGIYVCIFEEAIV